MRIVEWVVSDATFILATFSPKRARKKPCFNCLFCTKYSLHVKIIVVYFRTRMICLQPFQLSIHTLSHHQCYLGYHTLKIHGYLSCIQNLTPWGLDHNEVRFSRCPTTKTQEGVYACLLLGLTSVTWQCLRTYPIKIVVTCTSRSTVWKLALINVSALCKVRKGFGWFCFF